MLLTGWCIEQATEYHGITDHPVFDASPAPLAHWSIG